MSNKYQKSRTVQRKTKKMQHPQSSNHKNQTVRSQDALPDNVSFTAYPEFTFVYPLLKEMHNDIREIKSILVENELQTTPGSWSASTSTHDATPDMLTKEEVSEMLRVDVRTISNYVKKGYLHPIKLPSGILRFQKSDVMRCFEKKDDKNEE